MTTQPPLVPAQHHPSHPLFTPVPPSQYSHRQPVPLQPCLLDQPPPVSTPPVLQPHPCPSNPVSTQSLVKHYYSTVTFILHLVQTSFFKPCLCSTVVLPIESSRDKCQCNYLWSHLKTIPITQSYPRWLPRCPQELCPTCCHFRSSSTTHGSCDCHLCCRHLHHTQT